MRRAALLLCLAACTPKAPLPPPALPLYAGCAAVAEGPVCLLDEDSKLRVWLPTAPSKVEGAEQLRVEAVEGGHLVWLRGTGAALELHAPGARWRLRLGKASPDEAWAALKAQGLEARRKGDPKRAGALFEEAAKASATLSGRRLARVLQGFVAYDSGDFAAARAALDPLPDLSSTWPAGEVQREFNRSVVLTETGDFRGALAALEVAEGLSRKLKLSLLAFVRRGQAELQLHLGDYAGARAAFAGLAQDNLGCGRAELEANAAFTGLLDAEAEVAPLRAELRAAMKRFDTECPDAPLSHRGHLLVNLAVAASRAEDWAAVERWTKAARALPLDGETRAWIADLEGRRALAGAAPAKALERFDRLAAFAEAIASPEHRWRAAVGQGRAYLLLDNLAAAEAAYRRAEDSLFDESLAIPPEAGRLRFLSERGESAERLVDLLLRTERPEAALEATRRARRRALLGLWTAARSSALAPGQRLRWEAAYADYRAARSALERAAAEDWRLTAEEQRGAAATREADIRRTKAALDRALQALGHRPSKASLPPRAPGETLLAWARTPTGWAVLQADDHGASAHRLPAGEPSPAWMLGPYRPHGQVRLLVPGALARVDVHGALVGHATPRFALDLPKPVASGSGRALLVADPRGDLRAAVEEAKVVAAALADWGPLRLEDRQATRRAVLAALDTSPGLFHYAGHGIYSGPEGWASHLPLAEGTELGVGDILTLGQAPARVMLSGCETARSPRAKGLEGMGLAHAFVAAGATSVIAAWRPIRDGDTLSIVRHIYEDTARDPGEALAAAQRDPTSTDTLAFRVVVP